MKRRGPSVKDVFVYQRRLVCDLADDDADEDGEEERGF
jgi:hypothetical protein